MVDISAWTELVRGLGESDVVLGWACVLISVCIAYLCVGDRDA